MHDRHHHRNDDRRARFPTIAPSEDASGYRYALRITNKSAAAGSLSAWTMTIGIDPKATGN